MLNGWQRLWLFIGALSLIALCVIIFEDAPKRSEIHRSWADSMIEKSLETDAGSQYSVQKVRAFFAMRSYSDREIIENIRKNFGQSDSETKLDFTEIENKHQLKMDNLLNEQAKFIAPFLGYWALFMFCLYAFSWCVGWVARGFKNGAP